LLTRARKNEKNVAVETENGKKKQNAERSAERSRKNIDAEERY